jgi:hyperosmotically inducible protein
MGLMTLKTAFLSAGLIGIGLVAGHAQVALAAPQAAGTKASVVATDDKALATRIDTAMKNDTTLTDQPVDVDVKKGIVTLTGSVRSANRKARAGQHAHIAGVTRVDNQLKVDANAGKGVVSKVVRTTKDAGQAVGHGAKVAGQKTAEGAKVVGSKTADAASATGGAVDSTWITTKIHSKFGDEALLKGSDIDVDTRNHVVTLKGTVPSMAGSARAEAVARGTEGVNRVINQLVVSPKK